jgi:hypothetical protein
MNVMQNLRADSTVVQFFALAASAATGMAIAADVRRGLVP